MESNRFVIIGNGAAGVAAAETLREQAPWAQITILSAEPYPMYSRPGLAYVLLHEIPARQVYARTPEWYEQMQLELRIDRAMGVDVRQKEVLLASGGTLSYDRLLIATGARAVPAPYGGADLKGVVYLDTLDGTRDLLKKARRAKRAVVIGGGITALELSEGLAHQGVETHYFVRRDRLWGRVFNDAEAALLEEKIRAHHVHIHYRTEVAEIIGGRRGKVKAVRLKGSGELFDCDLVGVAIGVRPLLDVVQETPIQTDRGILVNEYLETSVPDIYAAGDCAQVYDRWTRQHTMDILWPSAVAEGHAAAHNMLGKRQPYEKGSPFNACLLFGMHITTIGQVNPRSGDDADGEPLVFQHLSRGSSEVWFTYPRHYASAWSGEGDNTIRLVIRENQLVGAVVIGDQTLADPLRYIIQNELDVADMLPDFMAGGTRLRTRLTDFWQQLSHTRLTNI